MKIILVSFRVFIHCCACVFLLFRYKLCCGQSLSSTLVSISTLLTNKVSPWLYKTVKLNNFGNHYDIVHDYTIILLFLSCVHGFNLPLLLLCNAKKKYINRLNLIGLFSSLYTHGNAHPSSDAQCGHTPLPSRPGEGIEQGDKNPTPRCSNRVAQGDGTTINVYLYNTKLILKVIIS